MIFPYEKFAFLIHKGYICQIFRTKKEVGSFLLQPLFLFEIFGSK